MPQCKERPVPGQQCPVITTSRFWPRARWMNAVLLPLFPASAAGVAPCCLPLAVPFLKSKLEPFFFWKFGVAFQQDISLFFFFCAVRCFCWQLSLRLPHYWVSFQSVFGGPSLPFLCQEWPLLGGACPALLPLIHHCFFLHSGHCRDPAS